MVSQHLCIDPRTHALDAAVLHACGSLRVRAPSPLRLHFVLRTLHQKCVSARCRTACIGTVDGKKFATRTTICHDAKDPLGAPLTPPCSKLLVRGRTGQEAERTTKNTQHRWPMARANIELGGEGIAQFDSWPAHLGDVKLDRLHLFMLRTFFHQPSGWTGLCQRLGSFPFASVVVSV